MLNAQKTSIIETVENILKKEIRSTRNSILYSVRKGYDEMKAKMTIRSLSGQSEIDIKKELGLNEPFDSYDAFVNFDKKLEDNNLNTLMVILIL